MAQYTTFYFSKAELPRKGEKVLDSHGDTWVVTRIGKTVIPGRGFPVDAKHTDHARKNPRVPVKDVTKTNSYITQDTKGNYVLVGETGARYSLSINDATRLQKAGTPYRGTKRNTEGFKDASGHFHPIRSGDDYEPDEVGEARVYALRKKKRSRR